MAVSAILFGVGNSAKIARCEIDMQGLDDVDITPEAAYQIMKLTRKKVNISGRWFLLWWKNRLFCIVPQGKDYNTFELSLNFSEGKENVSE